MIFKNLKRHNPYTNIEWLYRIRFDGRELTNSLAWFSQLAKSWSSLNPLCSNMIHPFMGLPVMSNGRACGNDFNNINKNIDNKSLLRQGLSITCDQPIDFQWKMR